jgi:serine/threonine protein kinase
LLGQVLDIYPQREVAADHWKAPRRPRPGDTAEAAPLASAMPPAAEPLIAEGASAEPAAAGPAGAELGRRHLGGFEVLGLIGMDGLARVYRGWQPMLERPVAIKCLPRVAHDWGGDAHFRREIRNLGRVRHPNLMQIYDSGIADDCLFYAMEWIESTTL